MIVHSLHGTNLDKGSTVEQREKTQVSNFMVHLYAEASTGYKDDRKKNPIKTLNF